MKKLITLSALCFTAAAAQAQITLQQSDFSSWQPTNEKVLPVSQYTAVPSANATYDLSTATYGTVSNYPLAPYSGSAFPQATASYSGSYVFSNLSYNVEVCEGLTAAGYLRFGEMINRQAFSLAAVPGGSPNDSLVFLQQTVNYSSPRKLLSFPATMGTNWVSNYAFNTNFEITVANFGLNKTPGYRRTLVTFTDTVKGWGKMRVKDANNVVSGYMDVLAMKIRVVGVDSFYLGGSPAPAAFLTDFSLTQGQITNRYYIAYYRKGEPSRPLLLENYSDAGYTNKTSAFSHTERLALATSVSSVNAENDIDMYPNPVVNGVMQIILGDAAQSHQWSYELVNTLGQKIAVKALQPASSKAVVRFNENIKGVHYITIYKNGIKQTAKQIIVQ